MVIQYDAPVKNMLAYGKHQFVACDRTLEIYFVGCSNNCSGCQNYFLKERKNNPMCEWVSPEEILERLLDYADIAKQVHILGGEPLEQNLDAINKLCKLLKEVGFHDIILFTGLKIDPEQILKTKIPFEYVDYVKTGPYDPTQPNTDKVKDELTGIILATTNQKIYKVK